MNKYRIRYKKGYDGTTRIEADSINGFQPSCDTYLFKIAGEIVAAIPKDAVSSIDKVNISDTGEMN